MSADRPSFAFAEQFGLGDRWITPGASEIDGTRVDPKAMDVLIALVEAAPVVLSGAELLDRVWPNVVVVHNVVYQAIAQLRRVLGDETRAPRYIETIPRRGYRVVAEIKREGPRLVDGRVGGVAQRLHNLPNLLTSFVGRQHELVESHKLISSNRLIAFTGVGGCGKTRLAVALGAACRAEFADGVWLVELASITDETQVGSHVRRVLGVSEAGSASAQERLVEVLANKRLLLIIDNCEHLIDACAQLVDTLLIRTTGVRIVATSREALGIGGERALQVHPLTTPSIAQHVSLLELAQVESVQLFTERAVSIQPTFALTTENSAAVASICRRLDGIPLAIELAAAQVRFLSVEQISARLDDRFRLLTGGSRTALPRQRTLAATMDWSYELLPVPQRILLRRLSVFASGFTLEAAENITGIDPLASKEVLEHLTRLVDQSIVQVELSDGATRYRVLETVRQYGHDRLLEFAEGDQMRARHCSYFSGLASELRRELFAECGVDVFPRFLSEQDNLELALAWCFEADPEIGLTLANSLGPVWSSLGLIGRMHWFEDLLGVSSELTDVRVEALRRAGGSAFFHGDVITARDRLEQSLSLAQTIHDRTAQAYARVNLAFILRRTGTPEEASQHQSEALAIARDSGDQALLGECLCLAAASGYWIDDFELVQPLQEEGVALLRSAGHGGALLDGLVALVLGLTYVRGDFDRAKVLLEEALSIALRLGHRPIAATIYSFLGTLSEVRGDYPNAVRLMQEALHVGTAIDPSQFETRSALGRVLCKLGDYDNGLEMLRDTLSWIHDNLPKSSHPHTLMSVITLGGLMVAANTRGQYSRAARLYGAALMVRRGASPWTADVTDVSKNLLAQAISGETLQTLRARLGEGTFDTFVAEGEAMTHARVLEMALADE